MWRSEAFSPSSKKKDRYGTSKKKSWTIGKGKRRRGSRSWWVRAGDRPKIKRMRGHLALSSGTSHDIATVR